jgi:hypothetical protein
MYNCEIEGCGWSGSIRSKVKNKESEHYGKKVCPAHANKFRGDNPMKNYKPLKRTPINRTGKPIKRITEKRKLAKQIESKIRNKYFDYHLERCSYSEESGVAISSPTRANICHIFPKRTYKSVQANLTNCVYLTLDEHTFFDQNLDTLNFSRLEKMKCWDVVCERARYLLLHVEEHGRLKEAFEEYLKNRKNG